MRKKIYLFLAVLVFTICLIPVKVNAQDKISLNKAVEIAKSSFNLNTEGLILKQNYIENLDGTKMYELNWYSKKTNNMSISVLINAENGEIMNMNLWDDTSYNAKKIPKYPKSTAQKIAEDLIKKIQPNKYNQVKLSDKQYNYYDYDYYSNLYTFNFIRTVDGIEFPDNNIIISIDKNNLKVKSYYLNWDNIDLPNTSNITLEEAKNIFKEKLGLELSYSMVYNVKLNKNIPILVYSLKEGNLPIDANTGDIIRNSYAVPYLKEISKLNGSNQSSNITTDEQKEIDFSNKYITKEKAIEISKKYLPLDDNYKLNSANLYSSSDENNASWYLYWDYNDSSKNIYNYMNAVVDAVNGNIKAFYYGGSDFDQPSKDKTPLYDKEQCRKIAEEFIKNIYPEKSSQIEYREINDYSILSSENYTSPIYYFKYVRKNDGIVYNFNNIYINVNNYTGKVCGFNINWTDIQPPSKNDLINIEDAYNALFDKLNFSLKYVKCYDYKNIKSKPEIKLAYVLNPFSGMIDAKTVDILDYNGNIVKEKNLPVYTDIKGNPNENNIKLLLELGILKDSSDKFRPNDKILQKDFIKMLITSTNPYIEEDSYDEYYKQAISKNIISQEEKNEEGEVTRQQAAKMIIKALGLEAIANKSNIYDISKLKDANLIPKDYKGYIALSSELNIMPLNKGFFNPSMPVTRGDAATIIVNYLNNIDIK